METAILAGGCFWCTEAVFNRLKGVNAVMPGYTGGNTNNPNWYSVSNGDTGHAESIKIEFDPKIISFDTILEVFWKLHDPTTLQQPGTADNGPQYRSAIFYVDENQRTIAEKSKRAAQNNFSKPIITEITQAAEFYPAEDYHKNYYENNKTQGYCRVIIDPKIQKLYKEFKSELK